MEKEGTNKDLDRVRQLITLTKHYNSSLARDKPYNLFSVLRSKNDEVRLHSRFLTDLLSPKGQHGLGKIPLELFLKHVLKDDENWVREQTEVFCEYMNIDMYIHDHTQNRAVIIENKIYADDQPQQLLRYFNLVKEEGFDETDITIAYLTLDGSEPSQMSIQSDVETLEHPWVTISYVDDIRAWISQLIEKSVNKPPLRESLNQYLQLIMDLTNMNPNLDYIEQIKQLLLDTDSLELVNDLQQAQEALCNDLIMSFWNTLKNKIYQHFGQPNYAEGYEKELKTETNFDDYLKFKGGRELRISIPLNSFPHCSLTIEASSSDAMFYGIKNHENHPCTQIQRATLPRFNKSLPWWPLFSFIEYNGNWNFKSLTAQQIKLLSSDAFVSEFINHIVDKLDTMKNELNVTVP